MSRPYLLAQRSRPHLAHISPTSRPYLAHISPIPPQADLKKFIADAKITDQYSGELNIWNPTQVRGSGLHLG